MKEQASPHSEQQQKYGWEFLTRCLQRMPRLAEELGRIIPSHERAFLELGEDLQSIAAQAMELGEKATGLAGAASGEALEGFRDELTKELERFGDYMHSASSQGNLEAMDGILHSVHELDNSIDQFKKVVRSLQMLGISTRIESARLGSDGRGFSTLSDDVEGLAGNIVIHSSSIIEKSKELSVLVQNAKSRTEDMTIARQQCSTSVFAHINENMEKLLELGKKSRTVAENVAPLSQEITKSIGEAVASLQFHDITRQQVEHIQEALSDMVEIIHEEPEGGSSPERVFELAGWSGDVCSLQVSQLENAGKSFAMAVERLKASLMAIAENAFMLGNYAGEITGGGEAAEGSVLDRIENSIVEVVFTMREFASQGEQMGQLMVSVASTVSEMEKFLEDIEEVGSEIELIAINASVKAAHTGDKGQALGVLAQSIQSLSQQAGHLTEAVSSVLLSISERAGVLRKSAETFMDTSEMEEDAKKLETLIVDLKGVNVQVSAYFKRIDGLSKGLAQRLEKTAESITFHLDVEEQFETRREQMEELAMRAQDVAPHDKDVNRPERLKKLLDRYTMDVERLVHMAALQAEETPDVMDAGNKAPPADGDDDWDNVELF